MRIELKINGSTMPAEVDDDTPLLWVLRDTLKLKGTKYGCGIGQCGACTVIVDGQTARSCSLAATAAVGLEVTTIEGLFGQWRPVCTESLAGYSCSTVRILPVRHDNGSHRTSREETFPYG